MSLNFVGVPFNSMFVNTNGNVTLDSPLDTFTPFGLTATSRQIIAPFFADVDTRGAESGVVTFGPGAFDGRPAFGVNWINVGYFIYRTDKTNSFQLILVDRSDIGAGDFDIVFNYDRILWETGSASGGLNGFGGYSARAGFSNGTGASYELPGSGINGALLDGGPNSLIEGMLNSTVPGRYIFHARNGEINPGGEVPEPGTLALFAAGLIPLVWLHRRRS